MGPQALTIWPLPTDEDERQGRVETTLAEPAVTHSAEPRTRLLTEASSKGSHGVHFCRWVPLPATMHWPPRLPSGVRVGARMRTCMSLGALFGEKVVFLEYL